MPPAIKICGICNLADAKLAIDHGAKYLGFIFVQSSPRYIEPVIARSIVENLRQDSPIPTIVGVFQNASSKDIENAIDTIALDYVQLHGHESPHICASISKPVTKSFQITTVSHAASEQPCVTLSFNTLNGNRTDLDRCLDILEQYRPHCKHFLFDKPKNVANAKWLEFATTQLKPIEDKLGDYFLAGGLNAHNVKIALQKLNPAVVDIASGVEQTAREKNKKLMTEFFAALDFKY